jgi:ketosteroid isomerase-like protein
MKLNRLNKLMREIRDKLNGRGAKAAGKAFPGILLVLLPLFFCSCEIFSGSNGTGAKGTAQQSPKAQAEKSPKVQPAVAPQEPPKVQPVVVPQQTPKAQAAEPRPQPPAPPVNTDAARKILLGLDLAFSRACEERGAPEAFYDFMATDGVCLVSGEQPIQGRDAIKVRFAAFPAESISWKPRESEISTGLDLGYTWGLYESRATTADKQNSTHGKYVIVWKKQSDGEWKASVFSTSVGPVQRKEE